MTTTEGASPAPTPEQVEQALQACRAWTVLPDPNGTAHVLAAEVLRQRAELVNLQNEHALLREESDRLEGELDDLRCQLADMQAELDRLRKIEDRARSIVVRKTCRCTTCRTAYRILNGEPDEDAEL